MDEDEKRNEKLIRWAKSFGRWAVLFFCAGFILMLFAGYPHYDLILFSQILMIIGVVLGFIGFGIACCTRCDWFPWWF